MTQNEHPTSTRTPARWRRLTGVALIVIAAVLAPLALSATVAVREVSDTDSFVATFAPLASDPGVQDLVSDRAVAAITERVDFSALVAPVFDSLSANLGPVGSGALRGLEGVAVAGIRQLVEATVVRLVHSDAFAAVWEQSLRSSHAQLIGALRGDPGTLVSLGAQGQVGIELGPIVAAVRSSLIDQGIDFATGIPEVQRTIVIASSESIVTARGAYAVTVGITAWLPWIALALLVAGVLLSGVRRTSFTIAGLALAVTMGILLIALSIGRAVMVSQLDSAGIPGEAASSLFDRFVAAIAAGAVLWVVLGLLAAVAAWVLGRYAGRIGGAAGLVSTIESKGSP